MVGNTEKIREEFTKLETRQDVADLLGIKEKSLRYFLYAIKPDNMYSQFSIKKKNGGDRNIYAPDRRLKSIQRKLANVLNCVYKAKPAAHGFVIDRNIITNAKKRLSWQKNITYITHVMQMIYLFHHIRRSSRLELHIQI